MIAAMLPLGSLPENLRFDGVLPGEGRNWMQFTELDKNAASFGASFYIDSKMVLIDAVNRRREEKRIEFAEGAAPNSSLEIRHS